MVIFGLININFGIVKEPSLEVDLFGSGSAGQAQLRSEFEALKQMARSQSESVEQLKGMDPGPTRVWTPRKPFGRLKLEINGFNWPKSHLLIDRSLFSVNH